MNKYLFVLVGFSLFFCSQIYSDNEIIYEGKCAVFRDGKILIFLGDHFYEVTEKEHYDNCACKTIEFKKQMK
jgi:hypothetical protein